jgi:eukaryotic-like serine/threonine-protein kinase
MSTTLSCPSCSDPITEAHRFCPSCGTSLDVSETPTGTAPRPGTPGPRRRSDPASPSGLRTPPSAGHRTPGGSNTGAGLAAGATQARFLPGDLLADRYRIVGLLGKGGMGEVYRADDLRLDQPVALKFLPPGLEADRERLERFYNEVRMARTVAHPAVCRVYDIGDVEGQHFLSMEYVDGENLALLLRRIGRLAADKAMDIAQQLSAGLAAAHDKGVLHRDLKPENVMLDGQGKVRITDFGLAGLEDSIRGDDVRSGTPAYMSPEQLTGREVTARSDVYSLGLVLYELFTGRKAFEGKTYAELLRKHRDETPIDPWALVPDLAPAVERTILRCIEKDPARRVPSARAVSVLLSGGDALAAAIAAGETPSPELVAAAGEAEGLGRARAWTFLAIVLAGTLAQPWLTRDFQLLDRVPVEKSPTVLEDRARDLLRRLGPYGAADSSTGLDVDTEYFREVRRKEKSVGRWAGLSTGEPPAVYFWYRQSPRPLVTTLSRGRVEWGNPPLDVSGMAGARYDLRGRLLAFYVIPPQIDDRAEGFSEADWGPLFAEAELDPTTLRPVTPSWTPPFFCDARRAWEGTTSGLPPVSFRVEAASYRGRPAAFFITYPWTRAERQQPKDLTPGQRAAQVASVILVCVLVGVGGLLAWRNVALGRGDRRGAFRTAAFMVATGLVAWALNADHVPDLQGELALEIRGAGAVLFLATVLWLFYLALEPYVRRLRPHTLISWTRLLSGGWRDAVVGRDVLVGAVWGMGLAFLVPVFYHVMPGWVGLPPPAPVAGFTDGLLGGRWVAAYFAFLMIDATLLGTGALLLFLILRLLLRRETAAAMAVVVILAVFSALPREEAMGLTLLVDVILLGSYVYILLRFGLLSAIAGIYVLNLELGLHLTTELGDWRAGATLPVILLVTAIGVGAFRIALGSRPAFGKSLLPG